MDSSCNYVQQDTSAWSVIFEVRSPEVVIARIRKMGEGNVFSLSTTGVKGWGYPISIPQYFQPLVPCPFLGGGTPVLWSHVPSQGNTTLTGGGVPQPQTDGTPVPGGDTQSKVGGTPVPFGGIPQPQAGVPQSQVGVLSPR